MHLAFTAACCLLPWMHQAVFGGEPTDIGELAARVRQAQTAAKTTPELKDQINAASWELLFGELAVAGGKDLSLWSSAVDCFDQGLQKLAKVETRLTGEPAAEERISTDAATAMRLDAVRVRQASILQRRQMARDEERARLNQLRAMVRSFRDVTEKMALADFYYRAGDHQLAGRTNGEVLKAIDSVYKAASARTDYYLFSDEPVLDENQDFTVVRVVPKPLSTNLIAHVKALRALAVLQMAEQVEGDARAALLTQSKQWAQSALDGTAVADAELPDGHDAENIIACHVMGIASEQLGVEMTRRNPCDLGAHEKAAGYFAAAKQHLRRVCGEPASKAAGNPAVDRLRADAQDHLLRLEDEKTCLAEARQASVEGVPLRAWVILQRAALRHRSAAVWMSMIEAARRSGSEPGGLLMEVELAFDSGVLTAGEPRSEIVRAKTALDAAWKTIAQRGAANLNAEESKRVTATLDLAAQRLRAALAGRPNGMDRAEIEGHLALALTYQAILAPGKAGVESELKEAYRLAQNSASVLTPAIAQAGDDDDTFISQREALIASRLACGHVCVRILPDYRDEGLLAFAAAFDQMAKLPFQRGDIKILGSPMITALTNRPSEASSRLAVEERRYRQLVTRFLEGVYALHFGDPAGAADEIGDALQVAMQTGGESEGDATARDAAAMLSQADGFDAEITLHDSVRAFKVLADSAAGRHDAALAAAIALLVPKSPPTAAPNIDRDLLEQAGANIQSPLVGFAFVSALEGSITNLDLNELEQRAVLLDAVAPAIARVSQLLETRNTRQRYPHLVALHEQCAARFASDDIFVAAAGDLRARGDRAGTLAKLEDGLKRCPRSNRLWQLMFEMRLEEIHRGEAEKIALEQLLGHLEQAESAGMVSPFLSAYYRGSILDSLGKCDEALDCFVEALKAAENPRDRIRTRSKISELQTRRATART